MKQTYSIGRFLITYKFFLYFQATYFMIPYTVYFTRTLYSIHCTLYCTVLRTVQGEVCKYSIRYS